MIRTLPKSPSPDPLPTAINQRSSVGHPTSKREHSSSVWCSPSSSGTSAGGYANGCDTNTGVGVGAAPFACVLMAGEEGERDILGRTCCRRGSVVGPASACAISNRDAGVVVECRRGSRTRTVCGLDGATRKRSVPPRDASAAREGGETVPLVEWALTVANASAASDVRRLGRMDVGCVATVKLLARLRLMGDGGRVVGLDPRGCWTSSVRSTGQRWTRRRNPCVGCGESAVVALFGEKDAAP